MIRRVNEYMKINHLSNCHNYLSNENMNRISFRHDGIELFFGDKSVIINVSFINHNLELIFGYLKAQLFNKFSEVLNGHKTSFLVIKKIKNSFDYFFVDFNTGICRHNLYESCKINVVG
jgi:hypothetical protein